MVLIGIILPVFYSNVVLEFLNFVRCSELKKKLREQLIL